jgi:cbb3-type cytochrome oxidase subunit 3
MHHNERWNILAGFIFAALFVAMLLCFGRTTYVFREASPVAVDRSDITVAHR